jgi:hemolysin activation/secretion protein
MQSRFSLLAINGVFLSTIALSVQAQITPDAGALLREAQRPKEQLPALPAKPAAPTTAQAQADTVRVTVQRFRLSGNTLLSNTDLQAVLAPWLARPLRFAELQQASAAVAQAYRERGWFARVQIPPQDVSTAEIAIDILEGKLGEVRIDDAGKPLRVGRELVSATMTERQKSGDPLNLDALERSNNILNDTPGVAVTTILAPGKGPGESDAVVKVQDKPLVASSAQLDNTGSRSSGEHKLSANLTLDNPSGTGDQVSINGNASEGNTYLKFAYSLPLGHDGMRVGANASAMVYRLVGADFEALKSKGDAQTIGVTASYPFQRSAQRNMTVAAALDYKTYYNEANGAATSKKTIPTALLALTGDWLDTLGAGGMTLWGVNLTAGSVDLSANATNQNSDATGARTAGGYTKLGYNLARLQRLWPNTTLWASFSGQSAGKNLDSSEKMALGGPTAVRAYPVIEGSGDDGWLATLELRYNLAPEWQVLAFYDHGGIRRDHQGDYTGALTPASAELKGAGFGLNWNQPGRWSVRTSVAQRIDDNPLRTLSSGKDQDGSFTKVRFWFNAIAYF